MGDDDEEQTISEEHHLLALKKRIEERKKERGVEPPTSEILPDESNEIEKTPKKKKQKKKSKDDSKLNGSLNCEVSVEKEEKIGNLNVSKEFSNDIPKKKKKHKKEDNSTEVNDDISQEMTNLDLNELTENNQIQKSAKKKRKSNVTEIINDLKDVNGDLKMEVDTNNENNDIKSETDEIKNQVTKSKKKKNKETNENISIKESSGESTNLSEDVSKNFTILKAGKQTKGEMVKRVLPDWLANPEVVSSNLNSGPSLDEITEKRQLDLKIIENLKSQGFTKLFPVQIRLLSWLLECNENRKKGLWSRDTCVSAPTGSGNIILINFITYKLPKLKTLNSLKALDFFLLLKFRNCLEFCNKVLNDSIFYFKYF